jgi:uncharacterized membrane protein YoaK (UPF0700 family)
MICSDDDDLSIAFIKYSIFDKNDLKWFSWKVLFIFFSLNCLMMYEISWLSSSSLILKNSRHLSFDFSDRFWYKNTKSSTKNWRCFTFLLNRIFFAFFSLLIKHELHHETDFWTVKILVSFFCVLMNYTRRLFTHLQLTNSYFEAWNQSSIYQKTLS